MRNILVLISQKRKKKRLVLLTNLNQFLIQLLTRSYNAGTTGYKNTKKIAMFLQQPTIEVLMVIVTIFSLFTKDTATVVADTDEVDTSVSVAYVIIFILFSGNSLFLIFKSYLLAYLLTHLFYLFR